VAKKTPGGARCWVVTVDVKEAVQEYAQGDRGDDSLYRSAEPSRSSEYARCPCNRQQSVGGHAGWKDFFRPKIPLVLDLSRVFLSWEDVAERAGVLDRVIS
jgi:hypothetical protein